MTSAQTSVQKIFARILKDTAILNSEYPEY